MCHRWSRSDKGDSGGVFGKGNLEARCLVMCNPLLVKGDSGVAVSYVRQMGEHIAMSRRSPDETSDQCAMGESCATGD